MCLAIPMKIESIEGQVAMASIPGGQYPARLDFLDNVKIGDYVLVHSGFAIEVLDENEALKTLEVFKEYEELGGEIPGRENGSGTA
ncbi:MAG: HypC/HybG/HupF family hydrogenase formation chaperone [Actinobacteria bacterium]|nr:HypC/HybG/HupF family hydrogenase formation chaperone [Actinomycetota bacterium]